MSELELIVDGKELRKKLDIKDGKTPTETELVSLIKPLIPVVRDGKDGKDGKLGKRGKDGSPDTGEQIVKKIKGKLPYSAIKGTPDIPSLIRTHISSKDYELKELKDVSIENPTTNQILKYDGMKWVNGTDDDGPVDSVNGQTGVVVLDAGDVGADPTGSAAQALTDANDYTDSEIMAIDFPVDSVNGATGTVVLTTANIADSTDKRYVTDADLVILGNTSGVNTGDQTSIVGITGTKAEFDTAVSDGNFLYIGDVTQYTDEMAQDAVGGVVGNGLDYDDTTGAISVDETELAHNSLGGLTTGDPHTQYAFLTGRTGGQTLIGDIDANGDISILGTSHATKSSSYVLLQPTGGIVGVGTSTPTNSNNTKFFVNGSMTVAADQWFRALNSGGNAIGILSLDSTNDNVKISVNSAADLLFVTGGSTERARMIGNNGRFGIGTSGPDRRLEVLDTANPQLRLTHTDGSVYAEFQATSAGYLVITPSGGNVGIGTTPNANAILDVASTTKAFMPPRMTTTQRDAIVSPTAGMVVYNSTTNVLNFYNGAAWGAV